tara:strand:+ start:272 stop:544 length:273 start_codon:yes stop_codon:yes gene_type:complete
VIGGGIFVGEDGKEEVVFSATFESGCQGSFQKVARHMSMKEEVPEDNPSDIEYQYDEDEDEEEQEMVIMFKPDPAFLNLIIDKDDDETVH